MSIAVAFLVRALLVVLFFPFSALDKILNFSGAVVQAEEIGARHGVAVLLIAMGLGVEILMPLGILTGVADRAAAFILAGYCGVTALLWKRFWTKADFWARGPSTGRDLFWDFLKNFALAGGFLLLTVGGTRDGVMRFIQHPLASSHPYAQGETR
jgi:putative oxidoreductase